MGTTAGLVRLRDARFNTLTAKDGLARDFSQSLYQDATGAIWISSDKGLTRYHDGAFRIYARQDGLPDDQIRAITGDRDGRVFVNSFHGVAAFDGPGFKRWPLPEPAPAARLTTMLADRSGALWVGTMAHGVIVQRSHETRTYSRADGLGDDYVRTSAAGLQYEAGSDTYTYVWKTDKSWKSTCRQLTVRLDDGSTRILLFQFK